MTAAAASLAHLKREIVHAIAELDIERIRIQGRWEAAARYYLGRLGELEAEYRRKREELQDVDEAIKAEGRMER